MGMKCNMQMRFEASTPDMEATYQDAITYVWIALCCTTLQLVLSGRQIEFSNTQPQRAKVATLTVTTLAVHSCYDSLGHLASALMVPGGLFRAFALLWFIKFILFAVIEMRYISTIARARNPQVFGPTHRELRLQLFVFYARFYCAITFGIMMVSKIHQLIVPLLMLIS